MANVNDPRGLVPSRHLIVTGTQVRHFPIASGYNTRIGKGDLVTFDQTSGAIQKAGNTEDKLLGVFLGYEAIGAMGFTERLVTWTEGTTVDKGEARAAVIVDPNHEFIVQFDAAIGWEEVGLNVDFDNSPLASKKFGAKGKVPAANTPGTATAQLKIMGPLVSPDNEWDEPFNKAIVKINEHALLQLAS